MKRILSSLLTLVVLAGAAGGWWWWTHLRQPSGAGGPGGGFGAGPMPPMRVEASPAIKGTAVRRVRTTGTLASNNSVVVRPEIAGRIAEILFADGETVRAGQRLVVLDPTLAQTERDSAEANLVLARQQYERVKALVARGSGTRQAEDQAAADLARAEATLRAAAARLEKTVLTAPWDGTLGIRRVSVGDFVEPGDDIVNLEQMDPIKVEFPLPERFLPRVAVGGTVELANEAFPGESFTATITAIDPKVDRLTRTATVQAQLANPGNRLRPGQFVSVTLRLDESTDAVFVPEQALMPGRGMTSVYRVVDGKAELTPVKTGVRIAAHVEILEGVRAGELVVTAGQQKIGPGSPVEPVPPSFTPIGRADETIETAQAPTAEGSLQ